MEIMRAMKLITNIRGANRNQKGSYDAPRRLIAAIRTLVSIIYSMSILLFPSFFCFGLGGRFSPFLAPYTTHIHVISFD